MQGRVSAADIAAGKLAKGYWCNLSVVGQSGTTGGFRVHRYVDKAGHECAYYDTALLFPTNALSLSARADRRRGARHEEPGQARAHDDARSRSAMQTPHESLNISVERGLLAAVMGNPAPYPGVVDVYDISKDCRHPELMARVPGEHRSATRAGWRPTARPSTRPRSARATRRRSTSPTRALPTPALARASTTRTACPSPTTATAATWPSATGSSSSTSPRSRSASRTRRSARSAA